jgi:transcriptional regulator with XRE-family HTH domain
LRLNRKLTQADAVERSGLPQHHISRLENGVGMPTLATMLKLTAAIGCKPTDLLTATSGLSRRRSRARRGMARRAIARLAQRGYDVDPAMLEIDHLFVCTSPGAPEADPLLAMGFIEGAPNRHPGQGTANRRIFFDALRMTHPASVRRSPVMRAFEETGVVSFATGRSYLLEIVFDGGVRGMARDCRPHLPLMMAW